MLVPATRESAVLGVDVSRSGAEEALLKAGALQTAILNSATFSSIATDAHGVIQIFNVGAERMLGYRAAEVVDRITPADLADPAEMVARSEALSLELGTRIAPGFEALAFKASRGIEDIYEMTSIRKDGSRFPTVLSVTALKDLAQHVIGYLLIVTDNTARQLVEAERELLNQALQEKNVELESARATAEKANLAKSEFLSSMSHELRTPLSAILGFAQLMESSVPPPNSAQKRSTDQILKAGWYLLELINEILDLSLIESGKLSLSLEPITLTDVVRECQAMIEPQARKRGIALSFPDFDQGLHVQADRTRLKQVLINLLSNAVKYNRAEGKVIVDLVASGSERVRISVRDEGEGLSPEKVLQLFQPFNRLGQETSGEEGTGIGLVVSKRLIELMGGHIDASSHVGKGSVFWIDLNQTAEPRIAAASSFSAPAAVLPGANTFTLLYVEDNPANLLLVEDLVARRADVKLVSAIDGQRGIEMARAHRPDVILMDINLPGINGLEALRILAEDPLTWAIPVVALSANAVPRDIQRGLDAGFFRYLTKPIKVNEFMTTLDLALQHATAKNPASVKEIA